MAITLYQASVPVFARALTNLDALLAKGAAHAEAHKIEPTVLLNTRLYPNMFPLLRQVQIASDMAKGGGARLAGVEPPKHEDTETDFAGLHARIAKTLDFLNTLKPDQIDGQEARAITLNTQRGPLHFEGLGYLFNFVQPNLYFHSTTAYAILRHCGVELGKTDFIGAN